MSTEFDAPQSRAEAILQNMLGANNELEPPQSRVEAILQNMLGANNELEPPQSREEQLLMLLLEQGGPGGGGGGKAVLVNKSISANGTYNASSDDADGYKKVTVAVPNTYAAGDEGKVVSNGALVSQTAHAQVTQNGTIDTTLNNSVEVTVPVDTQADLIAANNNTLTSFSNSQITKVRTYMFKGCSNLASINLPNVEELYEGCFYGAGLTGNITFEKYIKTAQNLVFRACTMTTITFKNGLFRIDQSAFEGCTNLTTIDIGNQAASPLNIDGSRFYNTPNLSALVLRYTGGIFPLSSSFPNSCNLYSTGYIYVPEDLVDSYKSASNWSAYASRIVKIEGTQYETHYANGEAI